MSIRLLNERTGVPRGEFDTEPKPVGLLWYARILLMGLIFLLLSVPSKFWIPLEVAGILQCIVNEMKISNLSRASHIES